jgi:hypothetical protein
MNPWREEEAEEIGWDDVRGGVLKAAEREAEKRKLEEEEVEEEIWKLKPVEVCWRNTGKGPKTVRWVDTNKGALKEWIISSRLVARHFKGNDKNRDDLFAEAPPLGAKRLLVSRAATRRKDRRRRKMLFIDVRKARLKPKTI